MEREESAVPLGTSEKCVAKSREKTQRGRDSRSYALTVVSFRRLIAFKIDNKSYT